LNVKYLNKCNKRGQGEQTTTNRCSNCNKEFEIRKTMSEYKKRHNVKSYCSKKCVSESQRKYVKIICRNCETEFDAPSRRKFCCRTCYDEWQNNKEKRECEWCEQPFITWNNGQQKYCCKKCALSSTGETNIETLMRKELERKNIEFKQYWKIGTFYVDFVLKNKIVIECDGIYWHSKPEVKERDKRKNTFLINDGYKVFRFTDKEILNDVKKCVTEVTK